MSDPLGVAAGITGVATVGFKIAQSLYQVANGIGTAGVEIRIFAKDISTFSRVILMIKEEVLRSDVSSNELVLIKDISDICEDILAPLRRMQDTLEPLLDRYRDSKNKIVQFGKRMQWYFTQKQEFVFYREALRCHQHNLNIVLAAMNYRASRDSIDQQAVENALLEKANITSVFHGGPVGTENVFFDLHFTRTVSSRIASAIDERAENRTYSRLAERETPIDAGFSGETASAKNINAIILSTSGDKAEFLTEVELHEIDATVNEDINPDQGTSAMIVYETIRVISRKVQTLAQSVLRETKEEMSERDSSGESVKSFTTDSSSQAGHPSLRSVPTPQPHRPSGGGLNQPQSRQPVFAPQLPIRQISTRTVDITQQKVLNETTCMEHLTTYAAFTININDEKLAHDDIIKQIQKLNRRGKLIAEKKGALDPDQGQQITNLLDDINNKESDRTFEWTLAQIDWKEKSLRYGMRGPSTMMVYLRRSPIKGLNPVILYHNMERVRNEKLKQQNWHPPQPQHQLRPPSGMPPSTSEVPNLSRNTIQRQGNITLHTPRGDSFDIPFEKVRSWAEIVSILTSIYSGAYEDYDEQLQGDVYNHDREHWGSLFHTAILEEKFHLKCPQGQIILPQLWGSVVEPGGDVSLMFKDNRLNLAQSKTKELDNHPAASNIPMLGWWQKRRNRT